MTTTVQGRTYGASAVLLLAAVIIFVLSAFDVHLGSFSAADIERVGLACFAASFLLP